MQNKCILTNRDVDVNHSQNTFGYTLKIADKSVEIFVCLNCATDIRKSKLPPKEVIEGLISNGKFPEVAFLVGENHTENYIPPAFSTVVNLPGYFETVKYPATPSEKMYNFLTNLSSFQSFDGEGKRIKIEDENIWIRGYFRNPEECNFYFRSLIDAGLIEDYTVVRDGAGEFVQFTIAGLNKIVELEDHAINSKTCFIAMKFDETMNVFREAIKAAIVKTGYVPYLVDEEHLNSDKTIPDGILSGIKKSKFCIADFTGHRNGVYFESGYAVGLGKPVIYLCEKNDFENTHFDIKQLQHIIYETAEELEQKLVSKIEAWIK